MSLLSSGSLSSSVPISFPVPTSVSNPICSGASCNARLRHIRLGHLLFSSMRNLSFIHDPSVSDYFCDICPLARQCRLSFPLSQISTKSEFEMIHVDTWGPYKVPTYNNYNYFITIVDDYTRGIWTYLLSTKEMYFQSCKILFRW